MSDKVDDNVGPEEDVTASLDREIVEDLANLDRLELKAVYDQLMEDKCRLSSEDLDEKQLEASRAAAEARKDALTYNSSVGASILTWDDEIFTGHNMENKSQKTPHAEQVAIKNAEIEGYRFTDYQDLYVVYINENKEDSDDITPYPACPHCQANGWDFTHPYLNVVVSDGEGEPVYQAYLKEMLDPPGHGRIFPSEDLRGFEDLKNGSPKLPLNEELKEFYERDEHYQKFCDLLGVEL